MKDVFYIFSSIAWVSILWGVIGSIAQVILPDPKWILVVSSILGGVCMWLSLYFEKILGKLLK